MTTQLFHKDVYAPKELFGSPGCLHVRYGFHARQAAHHDRYGDLSRFLNEYIDVEEAEIVEVEVTDGRVTKRVIRHPVNNTLDLVMVITADGFVKTVWGNRHEDQHKTLDRSKFVTRPGNRFH